MTISSVSTSSEKATVADSHINEPVYDTSTAYEQTRLVVNDFDPRVLQVESMPARLYEETSL